MRILALSIALLAPTAAHAYAVEVHELMTRVALSGLDLGAAPVPIDPALPVAIRSGIDARGRVGPQAAEWTKRYPTPESFDGWAQKELLLFAPERPLDGFDRLEAKGDSLLEVAADGSKSPDDDLRNVDRFAYDSDRKPIVDADGDKVPADPAMLNMGAMGSLSSQAHAHYGLADVEFSEDPAVLQEEPRRFAVAAGYPEGPILTLAAEMAQMHLDLALLAGLEEGPGAETLMWMHSGQGLHYVEDVGNQIHTVQVGLYDFFVDAFKQRIGLGIRTAGGYLGKYRSLASIGIDILTNHHTISEEFTRKRALVAAAGEGTPEAERLVAALSIDDPEFSKQLDIALATLGDHPERGEFGRVITETLIEASSHEGDDVYRATREIADPKWRKPGVLFDWAHDDPEAAVIPETEKNAEDFAAFWAIQEKGWHRVGTAIRRWGTLQKAFIASAAADPAVKAELRASVQDRLIARQTALLSEAEARRAAYIAHPPVKTSKPVHAPGFLVAEILVVAAVIGVPAAVVLSGD